ncbi:hypothetical protein KR038_000784 [Drosophila bunnanda]|nr:hypothetical protein KR038_000784 [Drosophila bunnanda]
MAFSMEQMTATIQVHHAVQEANIESQRTENELRLVIQLLTEQVNAVQVAPAQAEAPKIKVYEPIEIKDNVKCDEPLDADKCLPEFTGSQDAYVSWRKAAVVAYYIFRNNATFFILPDVSSFDAIIGLDLLKQAGASICLASGHLKWGSEVEKLEFHHAPTSPYNNPIWVVDKKGTDESGNRKMRLVLDFSKLNERTVPDRYPMPIISMILGNLSKAKYFTMLDLKSSYHQIILAERDREKTSFSVNGGYEFRRLPFGLRNAASIFQKTIDEILREQIVKFCYTARRL